MDAHHALKRTLQDRFAAATPRPGQRRYDVLAGVIRTLILEGGLKVGDALPAERDLVDLTGLGRGSVREAIRVLEIEGLLAPKKLGRHGMSVVQNASDQTVRRQLELFIGGDTVTNDDLIEARLVLEPALARIACDKRTDADIAALERINDQVRQASETDGRALIQLNMDWHRQLFQASHNDLLIAIAVGLTETQNQSSVLSVYANADHVRVMMHAHERILEAVVARDGDTAYRRTYLHLKGYADTLARLNPREFDLAPLNRRSSV